MLNEKSRVAEEGRRSVIQSMCFLCGWPQVQPQDLQSTFSARKWYESLSPWRGIADSDRAKEASWLFPFPPTSTNRMADYSCFSFGLVLDTWSLHCCEQPKEVRKPFCIFQGWWLSQMLCTDVFCIEKNVSGTQYVLHKTDPTLIVFAPFPNCTIIHKIFYQTLWMSLWYPARNKA